MFTLDLPEQTFPVLNWTSTDGHLPVRSETERSLVCIVKELALLCLALLETTFYQVWSTPVLNNIRQVQFCFTCMSAISVVPAIVLDEVVSLMSDFSIWKSNLLVNKKILCILITHGSGKELFKVTSQHITGYRCLWAVFSACNGGFYPLNKLKTCTSYF